MCRDAKHFSDVAGRGAVRGWALTARRWRVAALVALLAGLAGCGKRSAAPPTREPLSWLGLELGMSVAAAKAHLARLGITPRCAPARRVLYLDGDALINRRVSAEARARTEQCGFGTGPSKAGAAKGSAARSGKHRGRGRLLFVEGVLRQMRFVLLRADEDLSRELRRRWGRFHQVDLSLFLFGNPRPGSLRALAFRRGDVTCLWLRKARIHELQFFPHAPEQVRVLRELADAPEGLVPSPHASPGDPVRAPHRRTGAPQRPLPRR